MWRLFWRVDVDLTARNETTAFALRRFVAASMPRRERDCGRLSDDPLEEGHTGRHQAARIPLPLVRFCVE
ncbi:hypothetical protein C0Z20_15720 [Trinickia symbiotica]|uniref:Uncharacterized protein n=1 Tax=Trinickia symbiotica TaxID=863227 RepID=A0A2N7X2C2_9BURK|nr:hypothetical protein C0Z20_15720 [Trinickia symbiotica]